MYEKVRRKWQALRASNIELEQFFSKVTYQFKKYLLSIYTKCSVFMKLNPNGEDRR